MRGIKSNGMLLAASNDAHDVVEPLCPPEGAAPGTRVWFGQHQEQVREQVLLTCVESCQDMFLGAQSAQLQPMASWHHQTQPSIVSIELGSPPPPAFKPTW